MGVGVAVWVWATGALAAIAGVVFSVVEDWGIVFCETGTREAGAVFRRRVAVGAALVIA